MKKLSVVGALITIACTLGACSSRVEVPQRTEAEPVELVAPEPEANAEPPVASPGQPAQPAVDYAAKRPEDHQPEPLPSSP